MDKLLDTLFDIIENHITPKVSWDSIMEFIMGEENEAVIDVSDYYKIKGKKLFPSKKQRINIARSSDWSFTRLQRLLEEKYNGVPEARYCKEYVKPKIETEEMHNKLMELYKKYINQQYSKTLSESEIIKTLVSLYFLGTAQPEHALDTATIINSNYVCWIDKEEELRNEIKLNKITAIYGSSACGKTKLMENYLKENRSLEYLYIECETGEKLREKKVELKYLIRKNVVVDMEHLALLYLKKDIHTKLIIKCPYLKKDDIEFLNGLNTEIKIIVITRTMKLPDAWGKVYISGYPENVLKQIFEQYCSNKKYPNNVMRLLFDLLQYNPYLTELVAKHLQADDRSDMSRFIEKLHDEGEISIIEMCKGEKISASYRDVYKSRSPYSFSTMLGRILYPFDDNTIKQVVKLSIWARTPITKRFLTTVGDFSEQEIEEAINNGILLYTDNESAVQMPQALIWSIWTQSIVINKETLNKDLPELQIVIGERKITVEEDGISTGKMLLDTITRTEQASIDVVEYYYSTLKNIIFRYHMIYSRIAWEKETKKAWETYYVRWTVFLENAISSLMKIGNHSFVEWIQKKIYTKYKKKEFTFQASQEQIIKKQLEEFDLKFVKGALSSENWDKIIEIYDQNDIHTERIHIILDYFIQREINIIIEKMVEESENVYLSCTNGSVLDLLKKYLCFISQKSIVDERCEMYRMVYCYIKSIYEERMWKYIFIEEFWKSSDMVIDNRIQDEDINIRKKLYCFLFEWLIDWLDGIADFSYYYNKYVIHLETIEKFLWENVLSAVTTNLCYAILLLGQALSRTKYPKDKDMDLQRYLNQWLITNKRQYCVSEEYYKNLEELVNKVHKNIADLKEK